MDFHDADDMDYPDDGEIEGEEERDGEEGDEEVDEEVVSIYTNSTTPDLEENSKTCTYCAILMHQAMLKQMDEVKFSTALNLLDEVVKAILHDFSRADSAAIAAADYVNIHFSRNEYLDGLIPPCTSESAFIHATSATHTRSHCGIVCGLKTRLIGTVQAMMDKGGPDDALKRLIKFTEATLAQWKNE